MLSEFPTIHFTYQNISDSITNRLLKEELSYDIEILRNEFQSMHSRLNDEHIFIFDEIVNASTNKKKGGLYFVNDRGGTEKTFL